MKKRFRGLFALLLAMIMVIPSIAQAASEYEINEDNFRESCYRNVTHRSGEIYAYVTLPTINHYEAGYSFMNESGTLNEAYIYNENNIYDMALMSTDCLDDTFTAEFYLWQQGLKPYETENGLEYTNVVAGTPTKVSGEDIFYEVDDQSFDLTVSYTDDCGSFTYKYNIPAVIETYLQPNYTVPQGLTGTCGQTLADIELPEEATTFSDGTTPIGFWSWDDETIELNEEGTMTAKAIFTAYKPYDVQPFALPDNNTPSQQLNISPLFKYFISGNDFPVYVEIDVTADVPANPTADDYDSDKDGHYLTCGGCGNPTDTEPHVFDEGTVTKEPTEDEDGEKTFVCTVCGYTTTEVIESDSSSSEDEETPDEDETPADDTDKEDTPADDTGKDDTSTGDSSDKNDTADSEATTPQKPAQTGDVMNVVLLASAMIMALGCVLFVRRKEN